MNNYKTVISLSLAVLLAIVSPTTTRAATLRTVALSSDVAPGTSGALFSGLSTSVLNSAGQTALISSLTGSGVGTSNNAGIWSEGGGSGLELVARKGNAAPNASGALFSNFGTPVLNSAGQTAFLGILTGPGVTPSNDRGIWSEGGGSGLGLIAREGNTAPDTSGALFSSFGSHVLNSAGQTAFFGTLTGTGVFTSNDRGIWSEGGGSGLALIAREGNTAPDASGALFSSFGAPALNNVGQTVFFATLTGTGVTPSNNHGIWSEGGGNGLALVAREGNTAPDTSGALFSVFSSGPVLNSAGQTAFSGVLTGSGVNPGNDRGIWSEGGGSGLALVAREGNTAPDTSGALFSSFANPVLNGAGQTAFFASLAGAGVTLSNDTGIWSEGSGSGLELVAREGGAAPGASGAIFSSFNGPVLNSAGQTAFWGILTGTGVTPGNDRGIWAQDASGNLTLIAREGDLLDVDDGPGIDLRTVSGLGFFANTGNEDGRRSGFNDLGQLTFRAIFTDGSSGVFVSDLATIPEPTSLALLSLAALVLAARRRMLLS